MSFKTITIIGFGLIGSSLARQFKAKNLCEKIVCADVSQDVCDQVKLLGLADEVYTDLARGCKEADLVVICVPVGAYKAVGQAISSSLKSGAVVTDVGSVKFKAIKDLQPFIPADVSFVPSHPIAGTEKSGPEHGFGHLFEGRWFIVTPIDDGRDALAVKRVCDLWYACGANVEIMTPKHHDKVLGITSHLPHLIAFSIVGTATDLEDDIKGEVIKYSAGGFRDFTRIAAGDPTMWRDIFLNNKYAMLEMIQRFNEDLTELQKAIRQEDGDKLYDLFLRTSQIRKGVVQAKQDDVPTKGS